MASSSSVRSSYVEASLPLGRNILRDRRMTGNEFLRWLRRLGRELLRRMLADLGLGAGDLSE